MNIRSNALLKNRTHASLVADEAPAEPTRTPKRDRRTRLRLTALVAVLACAGFVTATGSSAEAAPNGAYSYLVARHSGKCVDITGGSTQNTARAQQYTCLGINQHNQQFRFVGVPGSPGYFQIVAVHSGKCLDVSGGNTATGNGTMVFQWDCLGTGQYNQQWRLVRVGTTPYFNIVARHSGKCLDVTGGSTANGAMLQQYTCLGAGQYNQQFAFHGDVVLRSGDKSNVDGIWPFQWHQDTSAQLIEEVDQTTNAHLRAYVVATTTSWADTAWPFDGHATVELFPSNVVKPNADGQPTHGTPGSPNAQTWGGPTATPVSLSTADTTTNLLPHNYFTH